jgi:hypothetical protein
MCIHLLCMYSLQGEYYWIWVTTDETPLMYVNLRPALQSKRREYEIPLGVDRLNPSIVQGSFNITDVKVRHWSLPACMSMSLGPKFLIRPDIQLWCATHRQTSVGRSMDLGRRACIFLSLCMQSDYHHLTQTSLYSPPVLLNTCGFVVLLHRISDVCVPVV